MLTDAEHRSRDVGATGQVHLGDRLKARQLTFIVTLLSTALLTPPAIADAQDRDPRLIGSWQDTSSGTIWTFLPNGNMTYALGEDAGVCSSPLAWTAAKGQVTVYLRDGGWTKYGYTFVGSYLSLSYVNGEDAGTDCDMGNFIRKKG
jgi:hypothetical protein